MSKLHIVQHMYCHNNWEKLARYHYQQLTGQQVNATVIGSSADLIQIERIANKHGVALNARLFSAPATYEHEAMMWVQELAQDHPDDYVLYFHSKGAGNNSRKHQAWNHYMSYHMLHNLGASLEALRESNFDITGVLFTERKRDPNLDGQPSRFFAGNFWIAKNTYINTLPSYKQLLAEFPNRYLSERFIGLGNPTVCLIDQTKPYSYKGLFGVLRKINGLQNRGW